jgi:hypothetical protein
MQTHSLLRVGGGEWCCRLGATESKGRQNGHFNKKKMIFLHSSNFKSLSRNKGDLKKMIFLNNFLNFIIYFSATYFDYSLRVPKT